jgi:hypothetical protein
MHTLRHLNIGRPGSIALTSMLLFGCSASGSAYVMRGGSSQGEHRRASAGSETPRPATSAATLTQDDGQRARGGELASSPSQREGADDAEVATTSEKASDRDRGHGNDPDGIDEDNPGRSKRKATKKAKPPKTQDGDHDRGHGNDPDGIDEDNPGRSKKK